MLFICLCKLSAALPWVAGSGRAKSKRLFRMWVVQSEWEGGSEHALSCFPKRERGKEGCKEERAGQSYGARLNMGPHLSSRCGLHSCPTQREKRRKRFFRSEGKLVLNLFFFSSPGITHCRDFSIQFSVPYPDDGQKPSCTETE